MIFGIGVDLLAAERMAQTHARYGERLHRRLLHPAELEALGRARDPDNFLAKSFAAKEAFVKAMGTGFRGITHADVGVVRNDIGRPQLVFSAALQARLQREGICSTHLAFTDDTGLVCAMVVLETR